MGSNGWNSVRSRLITNKGTKSKFVTSKDESIIEFWETIGATVRELRTQQGVTQIDLAQAMRVHRTSVANLECGYNRMPLDKLYILAHILGVEPKSILPDEIGVPKALYESEAENEQG